MKRYIAVLLCLIMALSALAGCTVEDQQISHGNVTITVPGDMEKQTEEDAANFDFAYTNKSVALMGLYEDLKGTWLEGGTAEEYAQAVIENNQLTATPEEHGDYWTFTYKTDVDGDEFTYLAGIFQDGTGYWMIQVACSSKLYSVLQDRMFAILDSVTIG